MPPRFHCGVRPPSRSPGLNVVYAWPNGPRVRCLARPAPQAGVIVPAPSGHLPCGGRAPPGCGRRRLVRYPCGGRLRLSRWPGSPRRPPGERQQIRGAAAGGSSSPVAEMPYPTAGRSTGRGHPPAANAGTACPRLATQAWRGSAAIPVCTWPQAGRPRLREPASPAQARSGPQGGPPQAEGSSCLSRAARPPERTASTRRVQPGRQRRRQAPPRVERPAQAPPVDLQRGTPGAKLDIDRPPPRGRSVLSRGQHEKPKPHENRTTEPRGALPLASSPAEADQEDASALPGRASWGHLWLTNTIAAVARGRACRARVESCVVRPRVRRPRALEPATTSTLSGPLAGAESKGTMRLFSRWRSSLSAAQRLSLGTASTLGACDGLRRPLRTAISHIFCPARADDARLRSSLHSSKTPPPTPARRLL